MPYEQALLNAARARSLEIACATLRRVVVSSDVDELEAIVMIFDDVVAQLDAEHGASQIAAVLAAATNVVRTEQRLRQELSAVDSAEMSTRTTSS